MSEQDQVVLAIISHRRWVAGMQPYQFQRFITEI